MKVAGTLSWVALVSLVRVGWADPCSQPNTSQGFSFGDQLNVSSAQLPAAEIGAAITYWAGSCTGYGSRFPSMSMGGSGGIPITVEYFDAPSALPSGSCGRTTPSLVGPSLFLRAAKIEIWKTQGNGVPCNRVDTLAHELGHVLGLKDKPLSTCLGRIMGERPAGGTRAVTSSDCGVAAERWITSTERPPGPIGRPPRCRDD